MNDRKVEASFSSEMGADWRKEFRELQPVELWGATMSASGGPKDFKVLLVKAAKQIGKNHFGYFIYPESEAAQYHLSKYPRRKYGSIPSTDAMRDQLTALSAILGQEGREEITPNQSRFRIVLGLEEGYGTGKFRALEDVRAVLGDDFDLTRAEVFTVKVSDGSESTYQEPAVMIEGNLSDIQAVYALAEDFKQERFAVDDFERQTSHIVETKFCSSPDPE